jgi:tetratricopeptide (TPR) repeat protein
MDKFMHKAELTAELETKGDYIQMDYINRFLKLIPPHEMRKFAYGKLGELYMKHQMFKDASKIYQNIALNSITYKDKIKYFLFSTKALLEGGFFEDAERALKRATGDANSMQKQEIAREMKSFYFELAENLIKKGKTNKATIYYEKLLRTDLLDSEKEEIKIKLRKIYESLGKISEIKLLDGF